MLLTNNITKQVIKQVIFKVLILGILLLPLLTFYLGIKYQESRPLVVIDEPTIPQVVPPTVNSSVCNYGLVPKEDYLVMYTVKKGDNLPLIAKNQLGDTTRAKQIIALNRLDNPLLNSSDSFIEVGWELYLPSKEFLRFTGIVDGIFGKLVTKGNLTWEAILSEGQDARPMPIEINEKTIFLDNEPFEIGDCLSIFRNGVYTPQGIYEITMTGLKHQR